MLNNRLCIILICVIRTALKCPDEPHVRRGYTSYINFKENTVSGERNAREGRATRGDQTADRLRLSRLGFSRASGESDVARAHHEREMTPSPMREVLD